MQFNFVISTNERTIRLWQSFGFEMVGRLCGAFLHPTQGYVEPTSCIAIFSAVCADTRGYATHAACLILPLPSNDSSMS